MDNWNSLEIAKLIVTILTPLVIVILGFWFNKRLKTIEHEKQEELNDIERRHQPHIEFSIRCNFFGPENGVYAAEFVITSDNKSLIRHNFKSIKLNIRGIKRDSPLKTWEEHPPRLEFPEPILKDEEVVPNWKWNYFFVEPGVKQNFYYITPIDESYKYITARAEFYYDEFTPHSTEKMFEVTPGNSSSGKIRGI